MSPEIFNALLIIFRRRYEIDEGLHPWASGTSPTAEMSKHNVQAKDIFSGKSLRLRGPEEKSLRTSPTQRRCNKKAQGTSCNDPKTT